jgi:triosephosphate isomerase
MRTPVIAGNWKMNLDRRAALELVHALGEAAASLSGVEIGVAPPFPYLQPVGEALASGPIWMAGQDLHWESSGAYTGDVSGEMLADVGCSKVIVGHSERRHGRGESPEEVGRKVRAALRAGLGPILCVGETLEEREAGRTDDVVLHQMDRALEGVAESELAPLIVAYEPVWAIGTGRNATPEQAGEVHRTLRAWIRERYSNSLAESVRIQYGGSVKGSNARELLSVEDVDGALVGGASLDAGSFLDILRAAAS